MQASRWIQKRVRRGTCSVFVLIRWTCFEKWTIRSRRKQNFINNSSLFNFFSSAELNEAHASDLYEEVFHKTDEELDFDGQGGQQLLRILLQMTMSDYSKLTSTALKVLFRHFTQYQELVEDLKQVFTHRCYLNGFFTISWNESGNSAIFEKCWWLWLLEYESLNYELVGW